MKQDSVIQKPKKYARYFSKEQEMIRLKEIASQMNETEKVRTVDYLKQEDGGQYTSPEN